jgi:site-specific recombinase XerD
MLGHVQLSTTEIYTHVSIDALKAVHTEVCLTLPRRSGRK